MKHGNDYTAGRLPRCADYRHSSLYATRVTRIQGVVLRESVGVVTFGHATTKMAVIQFDSQWR